MTRLEFDIQALCAWAPGLESAEDWKRWAREPTAPFSTGRPAIPDVPPNLRRRCGQQDAMLLHVGLRCLKECTVLPPVVVGSRHGEARATRTLLDLLAELEPLSPQRFSLSVHNASAGLLSIVTKNTQMSRSIAAARDTFPAALLEATSVLRRSTHVLLILVDEACPEDYRHYLDERPATFAIGLLLGRGPSYQLELVSQTGEDVPVSGAGLPLPHALEFARWFFGEPDEPLAWRSMHRHWRLRAARDSRIGEFVE